MDKRIAFSDFFGMDIINGGSSSSVHNARNTESSLLPANSPAENSDSLRRLSDTFESMFLSQSTTSSSFNFFSDARLVVASSSSSAGGDGKNREIPVHRCILSARSPFFRNMFLREMNAGKIELKKWMKDCDVSFDVLVMVIGYLYSGRMKGWPKEVIVCVDDECCHEACMPRLKFMVEVLYSSFMFHIPELVDKFQRHLLDVIDKAAADDIVMVLSVANACSKACESLFERCIQIIIKSDVDVVTLDKALSHNLLQRILEARLGLNLQGPNLHAKNIQRALDSNDVELVSLILKEGHITLDDAYALHYAVAYCNAKTTTELLDLNIADVNRRNQRGYTVLHVAARRKDPQIIVSLLSKGARPSDFTSDGRKALQMCKRVTSYSEYRRPAEEGKGSSKDRICIEILEQSDKRDPLLGEASVSLATAGDELRMKLLYLENRVALAKLLFPMEAKVAMDIAQVDGTSEFPLAGINQYLADAQRITVDLNEAPFKMKEDQLNRITALSRTVELGKRFFPLCSEVLKKVIDTGHLSKIAYMGNETPEEHQQKKQRYIELKEVISKAFVEDKQEFHRMKRTL